MKPYIRVYGITAVLTLLLISGYTSLCWSQPARGPEQKLVDANIIMAGFEQGSERVKVIVNLAEPAKSKPDMNWNSKDSLETLHSTIGTLQGNLLSTLSENEFKVRYRFENQAGFSGEVTLEGLAKLLADPKVDSIEPVYILQEHLAQGIPLINASEYRSIYNGQGVAIAVVDTGIDYTHPKLGAGGFPNRKVIGGYDFGEKDSNPFPNEAHGTCCAGIAAGDPNDLFEDTNDYIGGVATGAKLYALKVADSEGNMYNDAAIAAWDWCITHKNDESSHPILVITTSLGDGHYMSACDCLDTSEDFETGDFLKFPWNRHEIFAMPLWTITTNEKHSGDYSAKAGKISHNKFTALGLLLSCSTGNVEFYVKVSSEKNYDGLGFYIDGKLIDLWSGIQDWQRESYPVPEGEHNFSWIYFKDASRSIGSDTAWIDDIKFPVACPSAFATAANKAVAAGITVLASSGNDGYCESVTRPACLSNVISVGAVYDADIGRQPPALNDPNVGCISSDSCAGYSCPDSNCYPKKCYVDYNTAEDQVPTYSNTSNLLDVFAPSNNAYTTDIIGLGGYSDGDYKQDFNGTSAACPYAAGAVACLQSAVKAWTGRHLTPSQVRDYLISTGDAVTDKKAGITKPRINLRRAIEKAIPVKLSLDNCWMYQSLPGRADSRLQAVVEIINDPCNNGSYKYKWEFILPRDVTVKPTIVDGGGPGEGFCTLVAPACNESAKMSISGAPFQIQVTVTGNDHGNTATATADFGIALLGDVNNDCVVDLADRSIINAFWKIGSAGSFSLRDCDLNCDGVVDLADRSIANAIWKGTIGQNKVNGRCQCRSI